ncbi:hypothetical protein A1O7_09564 [Cladophialophora yegresii CBS 114405]|uniref:Uncharacterized protein n=1 Tax=Cladophialophora yegresii CBS 114405 TaxID=1182544 RepID=W9VF25_9EURO|nr:uncharacterized protein A1O7_09564 [Cladophialophora yegresii CBS 114405]EXJ54227.1 hypothetical protein A1O7_09564 [Cladophialophora yegresii CBS 114405]
MYQQPHLVPPMKLTVFDELPPTPTPPPPSQLSQWVSQGKASLRSSLSTRRHASRPSISAPQPPLPPSQQLPLRRAAQSYRPLELSIYMPSNRLSDLPAFDRLSFTEVGEIKLPPRALVRTKSEEFVPHKISMLPATVKPASMIEQRRASHVRADTSSTVIAISRPPSEYDALHSHPVSWASLPGLPPPIHLPGGRPEASVTVLSPMQEEFSPGPTSVAIGDTVLNFPSPVDMAADDQVPPEAPAPPPFVPPAPSRNFSKPADMNSPSGYFHPNYQTQKRISQWLAHRTSSSISTTKSSSTSSSFAEHRRKRSQFYQLSATAVAPPKPLSLWSRQHQRTMTESTIASTVDTDILSHGDQSRTDATSVTTYSENLQSRSGTVRSVAKSGLRPIVSGVPDMPPCYADIVNGNHDILIKEIGGPLRSPGVGVAF